MGNEGAALFFLESHNEVDQIVPILYKLGERGDLPVTVVLEGPVTLEDYRIRALRAFDNVRLLDGGDSSGTRGSLRYRLTGSVKTVGRKIPSELPETIYRRFVKSGDVDALDEVAAGREHSLVGFDWNYSRSKRTTHLAQRDDVTTVVLPHGDSPFRNQLEEQSTFDEFVSNVENFTSEVDLFEAGYRSYEEMTKHDYLLFPNQYTANRVEPYVADEQIRVLGSPRYNEEWLDILAEIRPFVEIPGGGELNVVLFLRQEEYFVSKREVMNTLRLLAGFSEVQTIAKEHPRDRLLDPSVATEHDNIRIVGTETPSSALVDWGDVFLSLGTTITTEPIVRGQPVLELEYAHGNHTVPSYYFPDADLRCKEDLYRTLHRLLDEGTEGFYDEAARRRFVEEMVTPSDGSVLDAWADFVETHAG